MINYLFNAELSTNLNLPTIPLRELFVPMIYVALIYDNFRIAQQLFDHFICLQNITKIENFILKFVACAKSLIEKVA